MSQKKEFSVNKKYMQYLYDAMMGFFAYQFVSKTLETIFPKVNGISIIINLVILTTMYIYRRKYQKMMNKIEITIKKKNGKKTNNLDTERLKKSN